MIVVRTLGTAQIEIGETRILPTSPRKFALLLYLAMERGRPVPRSTLQDLIFPDQAEKNARHSLRELVYQLRQIGVPLVSGDQSIQLAQTDVVSDLNEIMVAGRLTNDHLRHIEGGFLVGYSPEYSERLTEWLESYRARSTFELCKAIVTEIGHSRHVGDWTRTERLARACLGLDELNEAATLALAESLAMAGAKAKAVDLLDNYIGEVGGRAQDLRVAPSVLRRRIGERTHAYARASQTLSPFVGREHEMEVLYDQMQHAIGAQSQCVVVVGEAGIGKSRLVSEFCQLVELSGINVAFTAAQPHDVLRPFAVFADLFQRLIEMPGALGISPESMGLLQRLVRSPSSDAATFDNVIQDSDSFSHAITHAIIDLIDAIVCEKPLLITIDDIPSVDEMSLRLLGYLLSGSRRRRLCVVVTRRSPKAVAGISAKSLTTIELHGVDPIAIAKFVETVAERDAVEVDAEMANWLQDVSGGHPFFLENLLAHYSSTRERFSISPSLSSLLRQRVDSLSGFATSALQTCAILGKFATLDTILDATQMPRFELVRAVRELEASHIVRADGQSIRPIHSLISDVALQRMTPVERSLSHQCAALALESRLRLDPSAALVWECAEQWYAAGNAGRALAAVQRCANHAVEMGRPEAAAQMLARALTLNMAPADRLGLAERLVAAADAAMDSPLTLFGIDILRGTNRPIRHDELEFAEFRARTRVLYDGLGQENELLECVADPTASPDHRVVAATLLLKYASSSIDHDLTRRAMAALPETIVHEAKDLVRLEYLMIAKSATREFEEAAKLARLILESTEIAPQITRLHLSINTVVALYNAGLHDEAVRVAERRYAETSETGAPHLRLTLATFLSEHFCDALDDACAAEWGRRVDEIIEAYPTLASQLEPRLCRLARALAANDLIGSKHAFEEMDRAGFFDGGPIRTRWRRVVLLRLNQLEGSEVMSENELQTLVLAAEKASIVGGISDAEAAVVCFEFLRTNRPAEAREFLDAYTRRRSSRSLLSRSVTDAARAIVEYDGAPKSSALNESSPATQFRLSNPKQFRRRLGYNAERSNAPLVAGGSE